MMLRLYFLLNQSSLKAFSARISIVSSTGTFMKRDETSYDNKMSCSSIFISWRSSANEKMSLMVWSLTDKGFSFSSSHLSLQVYHYKCGLFDTDYVGFTCRHLHQRVDEHKRSTISYHVKDEHGGDPDSIGNNFEILKKCQNKLDRLIF